MPEKTNPPSDESTSPSAFDPSIPSSPPSSPSPAHHTSKLDKLSAINEGIEQGNAAKSGLLLPSLSASADAATLSLFDETDVGTWASLFENMFGEGKSLSPMEASAKALGIDPPRYEAVKALNMPPSIMTFGRMSYAPDSAVNGGVVQWPGIAPDSLRKVARENVAPQLIIGMRCDDVLRYGNLSRHIWEPGWTISVLDPDEEVTDSVSKDIKDAIRFLQNSNIQTGYAEARVRDAHRMTSFQRFLLAATRDSLTFDGIALWTDMDQADRVKAFTLLPAGNIRLTTKEGYQNDPNHFAVAVDDGGSVVYAFTRDELTFYSRNPRTDPQVSGYGYPEIEIAMRLIKGFQNALDLNLDVFDRSAVANGIMTISGGAVTQRQLDLLTQLMTNMKKGITKAWALPVIGLQGDSKLEIIDLSRIKGNEAYYKEFMNMLAGALCTIWRFPVKRLGYRISGSHKDTEPASDSSISMTDEDDPGLAPLLIHLECLINQYILASRWPNLCFRFNGKNPKEDARRFEYLTQSRTYGEKRKSAGLPPLEELAKGPTEKKLMRLMHLAPTDANLSSIYQTLASTMVQAETQEKLADKAAEAGVSPGGANGTKDVKAPGREITESKDPARSEAHGKLSGVRRDSAKESS